MLDTLVASDATGAWIVADAIPRVDRNVGEDWMETPHDHRPVEAPRVSQEEAAELLLRGEALVIDVRSPEEYRFSHAPGAINIPLRELADRLATLPNDRPIVTYCT